MAKILLSLLALATMTGAASAQQRTIYDSRGNVVGRSATCIFSPCGRRCLRAAKADEGSLPAEIDPSPVSVALHAIDPPSPTREEGK
jgi:hypothetical protein